MGRQTLESMQTNSCATSYVNLAYSCLYVPIYLKAFISYANIDMQANTNSVWITCQ